MTKMSYEVYYIPSKKQFTVSLFIINIDMGNNITFSGKVFEEIVKIRWWDTNANINTKIRKVKENAMESFRKYKNEHYLYSLFAEEHSKEVYNDSDWEFNSLLRSLLNDQRSVKDSPKNEDNSKSDEKNVIRVDFKKKT
jgi:hypothetical protein